MTSEKQVWKILESSDSETKSLICHLDLLHDDKSTSKTNKERRVSREVFEQGIASTNKPGTAQVGAISKAQKDSKTKTTFSTTGDNKSSQN